MRGALARWLEGIWYHGRAGATLLAPLEALFGALAALRRAAFRWRLLRVTCAPVPVVVVGNLSIGGTGKSPLVGALATALQQQGVRVGILLRGYRGANRQPTRVTPDSDAATVGDEAVMLATATHAATDATATGATATDATTGAVVFVSPDRVAGAQALRAYGVELILCDDGLQHYALARDLEIVVIDGRRGMGNGRLLPAGPLRESVARLASVDWVVVQGPRACGGAAATAWRGRRGTLAMELVPEELRAVADARTRRSLESFRGTPVHAVAGIGHPQRFFASLRAAGLELIEHPFADHHAFARDELAFDDGLPVLMTSKDAVRYRSYADRRHWEVPVAVRLEPEEGAAALVAALVALTAAAPQGPSINHPLFAASPEGR